MCDRSPILLVLVSKEQSSDISPFYSILLILNDEFCTNKQKNTEAQISKQQILSCFVFNCINNKLLIAKF